jgi:glycosyltransferase involved in cell wall biosynthesis
VNWFYIKTYVSPTVKQEIDILISKYNIESQIQEINYISQVDVRWYLENSDFTIINKLSNKQNTYNFPSKLSEYLYFSKVLLVSPVGEMINFIHDGKNCFYFDNLQKYSLAELILNLGKMNKEEIEVIQTNAKKTVDSNFLISKYSTEFNNFIANI